MFFLVELKSHFIYLAERERIELSKQLRPAVFKTVSSSIRALSVFVVLVGFDPTPLVFQTSASTKLASAPCTFNNLYSGRLRCRSPYGSSPYQTFSRRRPEPSSLTFRFYLWCWLVTLQLFWFFRPVLLLS